KKVKIRDLTLRDGQQSLFATRMPISQIRQIVPILKDSGFYAAEVWGGAVPDSCMRYLNENPWERLREIAELADKKIHLTALSRGQNLFGYNPYPDHVIKNFVTKAIENGVTILRIFDALNDVNNLKTTIEATKEAGGLADVAFSYTTDPIIKKKNGNGNKWKQPEPVFTVDYWVKFAKDVEKLGADLITIKDMAGLLRPDVAAELIPALKDAVSIPIDFHAHCTPGYALTSAVVCMMKGVDIIDTAMFSFSSGSAAPSIDMLQLFADNLDIDLGVKRNQIVKAEKLLRKFRLELREQGFDSYTDFPEKFPDVTGEMSDLVAEAIDFIQQDKFDLALSSVHKLEALVGLPMPNTAVRDAQIPGGMYTNMLNQLKEVKLEHALKDVLLEVPIVRHDSGLPPLVTPTSQIVGVQAVQNVKDMFEIKPRYSNCTGQFINLVKGLYGNTPVEIEPGFREKITGSWQKEKFDPSTYKPQENETIVELDVPVAANAEEMMLIELFPLVAKKFLKNSKIKEFEKELELKLAEAEKEAEEHFVTMIDGLSGNYMTDELDFEEKFEQ
ncbi:MAG: carboxylase, partial [Planctomycetes bacterium]|nr:carboxylase [Planctomycetota bacterium]